MDIKIITNSKGSGDYIVLKAGDERIFEGHRVSANDLKDIIVSLASYQSDDLFWCEVVEVDDEEMEELQ